MEVDHQEISKETAEKTAEQQMADQNAEKIAEHQIAGSMRNSIACINSGQAPYRARHGRHGQTSLYIYFPFGKRNTYSRSPTCS